MVNRWVVQMAVCLAATCAVARAVPLAKNHAPGAKVTANSQFDYGYRPSFVADGQIPVVNSGQDRERAWAVNGTTHRDGGEITLQWDAPVPVKKIVHYGQALWGVALPMQCSAYCPPAQ